MKYIVNADDFHESNTGLDLLLEVKQKIPNFVITMFTVPGRCSNSFLDHVDRFYPWIKMVPHGLLHKTSRECENWDYQTSVDYLDSMYSDYPWFQLGFKAPGWQISDDMYKALLDCGYWVADQEYNDNRRPENLPAYILTYRDRKVTKLHYHIQNVCGNGLEEKKDELLALDKDAEFMFIQDYLKYGA